MQRHESARWVSRVSAYDLSIVIAVNSCENCCPETILKTKDATVEYNLNVSKLLKKYDLHAECTVRINENDEKCVNIVKNEILKIKNELEDS